MGLKEKMARAVCERMTGSPCVVDAGNLKNVAIDGQFDMLDAMDAAITAFISALPSHKGELSITHNGHKSNYETVEEFACGEAYPCNTSWVSDEQRAAAIASDEIWVLHWYPDTPVGFCIRSACDLSAVIDNTLKES